MEEGAVCQSKSGVATVYLFNLICFDLFENILIYFSFYFVAGKK